MVLIGEGSGNDNGCYGYSFSEGSGDGFGSGKGGYGYEYGSGSGFGSVDSDGPGFGEGDSSSYGFSFSEGSGSGSGFGYGYGEGSGFSKGSGSGSGSEFGYGNGDDFGNGSGYSCGAKKLTALTPIRAYHYISEDLTMRDGHKTKVGEHLHQDEIQICKKGYHASLTIADAKKYAPENSILTEVLVWGDVIFDHDKLVATNRKLIKVLESCCSIYISNGYTY